MKKRLISLLAALVLAAPAVTAHPVQAQETIPSTPSQEYVEALGSGWNLGNTFDGYDEAADRGETSWGNPVVTRELIRTVKEKGYDSIRLPFTAHMRVGGAEENYQLDEAFLDRYEEVVNWALEEDLYVMVNVHHDSWIWLEGWDGSKESEPYKKYVRIWEQMAERFKDYDERVMFESINEPQFHGEEATAIAYLETINDTFYDLVRNSGGNNAERMLVLPTLVTDAAQNKLDALYNQIIGFNDQNIIATVHYYSEWVYSANLGITQFDEVLWDDETARTSLINVFDRVANTFTQNGIGVVVGEYGLLGFDKNIGVNRLGETLKFLEFINYYADQKGINLMLWDNGQHLNRYTYEWSNAQFGEMIEASMDGRSSYAAGLDTEFLSDPVPEGGVSIPLTLNGNELTAIEVDGVPLIKGAEYTVESAVVQLTESYLARLAEQTGGEAGNSVTLRMQFTSGADWYHTLVYTDPLVMMESQGVAGEALSIPTEFNGNQLKSIVSRDQNGNIVSNNNWWTYLEHSREFAPDREAGTIQLLPDYTSLLADGVYDLTFNFYDDIERVYQLTVQNGVISGQQVTPIEEEPTEDPETPVTDPEQPVEEGAVEEPVDPAENSQNEGMPAETDGGNQETEAPTVEESVTPEPNAENPVNVDKVVEDNRLDDKTKTPIEKTIEVEKSNAVSLLPQTGMAMVGTGMIGSILLSSGLGVFLFNKKKQ